MATKPSLLFRVLRSHIAGPTAATTVHGVLLRKSQSRAHYNYHPSHHNLFRKSRDHQSTKLTNGFSPSSLIISSPFSSSSSPAAFVSWYLGMVKSRPIFTKSVTTSLVYMAADLSSQTMSIIKSSTEGGLRIEAYEVARMAGFGLLVLGPSLHFWFNFMSKLIPRRDLVATLKKTAVGQAAFAPIMTAVFFTTNAGLQGESGGEIVARLKRDLIPAIVDGAIYWTLCDFVTFKFVPVHLQPLVSNSFTYLWSVYMTYMASKEKVAAPAPTSTQLL
ncbi:unnamed protein product [Linum trigynum]|uniref:Uncharacterized protein n=1 Tax=Linum trigynum TaxID=586398 RepID=A0AAV2G0C0_9ROSI